MAECGVEDNKKLNDEKKDTDATAFDLKECAAVLKESCDKECTDRLPNENSSDDECEITGDTECEIPGGTEHEITGDTEREITGDTKCEKDVLLDDDEKEAEEGTPSLEYDNVHMKELHSNMTDEQLQELKENSSDLKLKGNLQYKNNCFQEAIDLYTEALNCCPLQFPSERAILYANRAAAYIGLDNKKNAVGDCDKALKLNPNYVRALLRRAQLNRKMDSLDQSLEDYKKVLEMDPNSIEARQACMVLPGEIAERNEKLKTEMLGKLKDLGNLVLRPFGLSTENFKMVQDPNSGGYNINFQR